MHTLKLAGLGLVAAALALGAKDFDAIAKMAPGPVKTAAPYAVGAVGAVVLGWVLKV